MLSPVCVATLRCRVPSAQQAFAPLSHIRIHLVLDYERLFSELSGSWLQASLLDGILDCGRPLVLDRGFAPLAGTDRSASEMFFTMLLPEIFERQDHRHRSVNLVPCGSKADHFVEQHPQDRFADSHFGLGLAIKWRDGGGGSPRTLEEAFAAASADAALVFQMSYIPDLGEHYLRVLSAWLAHRRIRAHERSLVLHYRAGRLPPGWHELRTLADTRAHSSSPRGQKRLPEETFWNNFWTILVREAKTDRGRELCQERAASGPRDVASGPLGVPCNASALLEEWCAASRDAPPPPPTPRPEKSFLLLGGDAHYNREFFVRHFHATGLLDRALWSFSTPAQCFERGLREAPQNQIPPPLSPAARKAWGPFCAQFANGPKRVDIELSGPLESSQKDRSFAPAELYARTRFSLVFESIIGSDREYPAFLTEKVLKPLYRGHPFLLMCHMPATWSILHRLGFHSFGPTMPEGPFSAFDPYGPTPWPCSSNDFGDGVNGTSAYSRELEREIRRLADLPDNAWQVALTAAAHNRRHVVCDDGLSSRLRLQAYNVLRFVAFVKGVRTGTGVVSDAIRGHQRPSEATRGVDADTDLNEAAEEDSHRLMGGGEEGRLGQQEPSQQLGRQHQPAASASKNFKDELPKVPQQAQPQRSAELGCQPWCAVSCLDLHGNVERECGGCASTLGCHRGAEGFDTWRERAKWKLIHFARGRGRGGRGKGGRGGRGGGRGGGGGGGGGVQGRGLELEMVRGLARSTEATSS